MEEGLAGVEGRRVEGAAFGAGLGVRRRAVEAGRRRRREGKEEVRWRRHREEVGRRRRKDGLSIGVGRNIVRSSRELRWGA